MAKHNRTGRSKGDAKHVRIYEYLEQTAAWRGLSGNAVKAWVAINMIYNGANNGKLGVSARILGERTGLSKSHAARAIIELENAGFLRCTKASDFGRKRLAAEYRLTHLPCDVTGAPASREFKRTGAGAVVVEFSGAA